MKWHRGKPHEPGLYAWGGNNPEPAVNAYLAVKNCEVSIEGWWCRIGDVPVIEEPVAKPIEGWVNVYSDGHIGGCFFTTQNDAAACGSVRQIRVREVIE